MEKKEFNFK